MTKIFLPLLCLSAALAPAQEVGADLKQDITELHAQTFARQTLQLQKSLGDAFCADAFRKQLETALREGEALRGKETESLCEGIVQSMTANGLESRDWDTPALMSRLTELTEQETLLLSPRQLAALAERVHQGMLPVLKLRERGKEQALLAANAERREVTTLSNGVQMEVLPGKGTLSGINRMTTETGIDLYERTTRRVTAGDLPSAIRAVAAEVPEGGAWIFWIPAEVSAAKQTAKADETTRRDAALADLMGPETHPLAQRNIQTLKEIAAEEEQSEPEEHHLLKITIWQDNPDAPLEALPDVR